MNDQLKKTIEMLKATRPLGRYHALDIFILDSTLKSQDGLTCDQAMDMLSEVTRLLDIERRR